MFKPEYGGSYEVFNQRPISEDIISYCIGDVQHLPELRKRFWETQTPRWRDLLNEEAARRIAESHKLEYEPHGPHKALAPWTEDQNKALDQWCLDGLEWNDDQDDDGDDDEDDIYCDEDNRTNWSDCIDDSDIGNYYSD